MAVWDRVTSLIAGGALARAAGTALDPKFETTRQQAWGTSAVRVLDAQTAAQAEAQGIDHGVNYADDAKRRGYGINRYLTMRDLAQNWPGISELLQVWRRVPSLGPSVRTALERQGYTPGWAGYLMELKDVLPPQTDLIRMAVREVFSPELRADLKLDEDFPTAMVPKGEAIGLSAQTQKDYWAAHWELPSFTQLQQMLFRTDLGEGGFKQALRALDFSPAWRDRLFQISHAIPTLTDMIRFAVREAYSDDAAREQGLDLDYPERFTTEAARHGLSAADAHRYWRAHWRYPSPTQAYTMLHRKIIDAGQLRDLLKILDYPLPWRKRLEDISYLVPGRIDLRRMYAEGIYTRQQVKDGYENLGYTSEVAEHLTKFAVKLAEKPTATPKHPWIEKAQQQLWTRTHTSFLAGDADSDQVMTMLAQVGVPAADRDDVLRLWVYERDVVRQRLTAAQVKKAWAKPVINPATGRNWTRDDALAELLSRGWSAQDANTYLDQ